MAGAKDRWTGKGKNFMKELDELCRLKVCVGFQSQDSKNQRKEKSDSKTKKKQPKKSNKDRNVTNLDVAMWNEFGTPKKKPGLYIPSRPFMRNSIDKNKPVIQKNAAALIKNLGEGITAKMVLTVLGEQQASFMAQEIDTGDFKPNAEITISGGWMRNKKSGKLFHVKGKKSDKPLIDTHQLQQSIHFVVRPKGDK